MATGRAQAPRSESVGHLFQRAGHHPNTVALLAALVVLALLLALWQRANEWYYLQSREIVAATTLAGVSHNANGMSRDMGFRLARVQQLDAFVQREADNPNFANAFATLAAELTAPHRLSHVRAMLVAPQGSVRYVYPETGNEALLGYNPLADEREELRADAQTAAETGELTLSGPLCLWDGRQDLVAWQAVYRDGAYWGLVAIVFDVPALLEEIGPTFQNASLHFDELTIHAALRDNMGRVFAGDPALFSENPSSADVSLGNEHWELAMLPSGSWIVAVQDTQQVFQGAGLAIVILATLLTYQTVSRQAWLQQAVARRTRQLEQANVELRQAQQTLEGRVEERTRELSTLLQMSRNVTSTLELDALLNAILDELKVVVDYSGVSMLIVEGETVGIRAFRGPVAREPVLATRFALSGTLTELIVTTKQPLNIPDIRAETALTARLGDEARERLVRNYGYLRSWLGLPLMAKERVIGVLALHHSEPAAFSTGAVELALAFANQAAIAIENANLFAAEQRRSEQLAAINEVGRRVTSILNVDELLTEVVRLIQRNFNYYHVGIGLVEGDEVVYRVGAGQLWDDPTFDFQPKRLKVGQEGMTGRVAATGKPLLAPNVRQEPHYVHMEGSQTRSELILPIKTQGNVVGVLDVQSRRLNAFDETDQLVLQSLADQVGVALENARLYEQAQELAALQEKQRLARELHDSVSQALYGIALGTQTALAMVEQAREGMVETQRLLNPLQYTMSLADAGLAEMRALIFELRPESLEKEGLVVALQKQAAAVQARYQLVVQTHLSEEPPVPLGVKQALYRVSQEALHNTVKHAKASTVTVTLCTEGEHLILEIRDDGRGFDTGRDYPGHLGLHSMRERIEGVGGVYTIESAPGQGTLVRATLPSAA